MRSEAEVRERIEMLRREIDESPSETVADGVRDSVTERKIKELVWVLEGRDEVSKP